MYNGVLKWLIAPETRAKMVVRNDAAPQELVDLFHPCQLEKRFGGDAETPK